MRDCDEVKTGGSVRELAESVDSLSPGPPTAGAALTDRFNFEDELDDDSDHHETIDDPPNPPNDSAPSPRPGLRCCPGGQVNFSGDLSGFPVNRTNER